MQAETQQRNDAVADLKALTVRAQAHLTHYSNQNNERHEPPDLQQPDVMMS